MLSTKDSTLMCFSMRCLFLRLSHENLNYSHLDSHPSSIFWDTWCIWKSSFIIDHTLYYMTIQPVNAIYQRQHINVKKQCACSCVCFMKPKTILIMDSHPLSIFWDTQYIWKSSLIIEHTILHNYTTCKCYLPKTAH